MWASSSSSSTPHDPTFPIEEVWNDVILPSDLRHPSAAAGLILQDLFPKEPPIAASHPPPLTSFSFSSTQHHFRSLIMQPHSDAGNRSVPPESQIFSGDRSHKRMMKNRVSAARSRARKQETTIFYNSPFIFRLHLKY
ncbi:protein FD-like [Salvia divinorum]|uniref:Protein FD-like n=1 Tax=Salvia divinorum TaxID=28513 RepID=A0ABD1IGI2_SALDI